MEEEQKKWTSDEIAPASKPRIRSEYSHLFEDNDEDPYEQIFRRVADSEEESVAGIPTHKEQAVAGLFEELDEPDGDAKNWKLATQFGDVLKKWPFVQRKNSPVVKSDESGTAANQVQSVEEADVPTMQEHDKPMIVFAPEEATAPERPAEEKTATVDQDVIAPATETSDEQMIRFGSDDVTTETSQPEQAEEDLSCEPVSAAETTESDPAEENIASCAAEKAEEPVKEFLLAEVVDDEEMSIRFAPLKWKHTEKVPKCKAPKKKKKKATVVVQEETPTETAEQITGTTIPAEEPVIVFAEEVPEVSEPIAEPLETTDAPAITFEELPEIAESIEATAEALDRTERAFEEETTTTAESVQTTDDPGAGCAQTMPPVAEPVAETAESEDESVIVFAEEADVADEPVETVEEPCEAPAELPSWNIKVDIPEEIKDVEGKLKDIPVEELPIYVFTEAQQEIPEVETVSIPVPDFDDPKPERKQPEPEQEPEKEPELLSEEHIEPQQEGNTPAAEAEETKPEPVEEPEPPQPICIKWAEDTFRPYRGKEIEIPTEERLYAPIEEAYQQIVMPIRQKRKQERRRKKRREIAKLLKEAAVETAVRTKDRTVAGAKKTVAGAKKVAYCLRPSAVYRQVKHFASSTADTRSYLASAILQMIAAGLGGLVLLALLIVNKYDIPVQVELSQYQVPVLFAQIHAIAMGTVILFSFRTAIGGAVSLVTRHCDRGTDGLVSLLMWFCLAQSVLSVFFYNEILQGRVSLYAPVCMLVLFMDAWGKLVNHRRVRRIRQMLARFPDAQCAGILPEDTELQARIDANVPDRLTVIREPETDRSAVIRNAVSRDGSQKIMRMMTYPLLAVAVLIGVLAFAVEGAWMPALAACTGTLCACAPLSVSLCMTLPASRAIKRMQKYGAAPASWEAVACFGEVGCAVVRDEDLYPNGSVKLMNVKVIREPLLESAVVAAAAVLHQVGGPLRNVFDRILTGEASAMPKADRVRVEENGGVVGWVSGIRVILGTGETLQKYNIQAPSRDYERKNCPEGQQFVYLASGGELVAMFILSYQTLPDVKQTVQALSDTGCDLAVCTADVNLTRAFLAERFELEEEGVELLRDAEQTPGISETDSRDQLVLTQGGISLFVGLKTCISAKGAMELAAALQFAGVLLGILLMVIFAATGSVYQLSNLVVALFELFWLTAVVLIPALRRM